MWTRAALVLLAVALLAGVRTGTAGAHANLVRSEPAANAVLSQAPFEIKLYFSEQPDLASSHVNVLDQTGARLDNNDLHQHGDKTVLAITVPALPKGTYTVTWRTVSAVDGHATAGTFAFSVGEPLAPGASALGKFAVEVGGPPRWISALARWITYASMFALLGGATFPFVILRPALRRSDARSLEGEARRVEGAVLIGALAALILGTVLMLLLQSWTAGSHPSAMFNSRLKELVTETRYGAIWTTRAGLAVLALVSGGVVIASGRRTSRGKSVASGTLAFAAITLPLTMSLNSHGAADAHYAKVATGFDWLHLVAGGLWVGGLLQLVVVVPLVLRSLPDERRAAVLNVLIPRFSVLAIACVTAIVATGVLQWFVIVDSLHDTLHSSYGVTLIVKVAMFVPLLGLGALNLLVIRPEIGRQLGAQVRDGGAKIASVFRRAVGAEVALGIAILAVTGVLTTGSPPFHAAANASGPAGLLTQTKSTGALEITLNVDPGSPGRNDLNFILAKLKQPIDKYPITKLDVRFTYLDKNLGTTQDSATAVHPTHFVLSGSQLSLAGRWEIEAIVRRNGLADATAKFDVNITLPSGPATTTTPGAPAPTPTARTLPPIVGQELDIAANNSLTFEPTTLHASPGKVSIVFTNNEQGVPHDVHLYEGQGTTGRSVVATQLLRGPSKDVATADLAAGEYTYICDVHPAMRGTLIVQ